VAETAPPTWSEKDDGELISLIKRSPHGKLKVDGKEEAIDSIDSFKRLLLDASRGRGANRFVEQTKKEQAEAKRVREEAEGLLGVFRRARDGDAEAFAQLGLTAPEQRKAQEEAFSKLPPEVQELARENEELRQAERKRAEDAKKREAEEHGKKREAQKAAAIAKAKEYVREVLRDLKEENYDVELPEIIAAMHALHETGTRIGRDYTPEQLAAFVTQRRETSFGSRFAALKPDAQLKLALPALKSLVGTPEGLQLLEQVLGDDFDGIATPIASRRHARWKASRAAKELEGGVKPPEERKPTTVSTPLPWQRY
jgi:hypothetical protein